MSALCRPTLVLNKSWVPIHVTDASRGVSMLAAGAAKAVDHQDFRLYDWHEWLSLPVDGHDFIRSAKCLVRLPEVICLSGYNRVPHRRALCNRRNILRRDHYTCQYCGKKPKAGEITVDHVLPRARGGAFSWENMVTACLSCNLKKADRTPDQSGMRLSRQPVSPPWRPFYAAMGVRVDAWSKFMRQDTLSAVG